MKKHLILLVLVIFTMFNVGWAAPPSAPFSPVPFTDSNCDQAKYYALGKLCQDSATYKLYRGTGAAVVEIAAGNSGDFLANGTVPMTGVLDAALGLYTKNGETSPGFIDFFEDGSNGSNYARLYGPVSLAGNISWTLPNTALARGSFLIGSSTANTFGWLTVGETGKVITTDGTDPAWSAYTVAAPGAAGAVLYSDGTNWTRSATPSLQALTLTGANTLALGTSRTNDGKVIFSSGTALNDYLFTIQASNFGANLTWTLPTAAPGGANYLLKVDADGTMGYTDPSTFNAGTATALAANPTDCSSLGVATAIDASGNLTCGYSINTDIQEHSSILDVIASGGLANSLFGINSVGTYGFYSNHAHDGSAAQFFDATDSTKTVQIDPSGMTTEKGLILKASFDQSATLEIKNTGLSADSKNIALDLACTDDCTITTPAATDTLVGKATEDTLTNKTLDVDGTGNVVKSWGYLILTHPHLCGAGAPMQTTSTARTYGHCKFSNSSDKATNYAEYSLVVPPDIDTSVDLVGTFKFILSGADTADHEYEISFDSVADSAAWAGSLGDAVSLAFTADENGASGDVETATATLTGWRSAMTAGQVFIIRVARDGDHANDGSTVDSYSGPLVIKYKITQ